MSAATRYKVGFESKTVSAPFVDRNPGFFPVVDTETPFAFGVVMALCDTKEFAERVCWLLNNYGGPK